MLSERDQQRVDLRPDLEQVASGAFARRLVEGLRCPDRLEEPLGLRVERLEAGDVLAGEERLEAVMETVSVGPRVRSWYDAGGYGVRKQRLVSRGGRPRGQLCRRLWGNLFDPSSVCFAWSETSWTGDPPRRVLSTSDLSVRKGRIDWVLLFLSQILS